ncbi:MAG: NAD(P)/FAD-dependent oxidoreductase, partial [Flavobacteriales bacterium]
LPPEVDHPPIFQPRIFQPVHTGARVLIIGAGPAGLFAALKCLEFGLKPIIIERGQSVRDRRRDLVKIHREHKVNPDSNYCFGEGGAGTYSDGKLYTRSHKRGDVRSALETLVQFGASSNILVEAHPHVGTNKLPGIIERMRDCILEHGGEVHFGQRVTQFLMEDNKLTGVKTQSGESFFGEDIILATGHSARDIFQLLHEGNISIEFKPFALGVRAEHPQSLIDAAQYHCATRPEELPAASYSLVHQTQDRGVYSFCMCPGGIIAPCATDSNEIVTNGWSPSKRNNPWANSGIVVPVEWSDLGSYAAHGPLVGVRFQMDVEQRFWKAAGESQRAPAQRIIDFVEGRLSTHLPACSYQPGVVSLRVDQLLPAFISSRLKEGFKAFGRKMKGYLDGDAILVGPESRTSSPVRIPRDAQAFHHPDVVNLYPCGEGAGYAGGIISAAMDGERVVIALV